MLRILIALFLSIAIAPMAYAQSSYRIKPGDTLNIEVLEDPSLNRSTLVLPDGSIAFPFVGSVQAGGRTVGQVRSDLLTGISANFQQTPTVFVSVSSLAVPDLPQTAAEIEAEEPTIPVYILGETNAQGKVLVSPGTSLLQFLAESGGFSRFAATKRIQLRRRDPHSGREFVFKFNYKAVTSGASISTQTVLQPGDVIVVPERRLFE